MYHEQDWQVANASMASWDPSKPWSPSGHDDCESKFHHILSKYLSFVELAGGKGDDVIQLSMSNVKDKMKIAKQKIVKAVKKGAAVVKKAADKAVEEGKKRLEEAKKTHEGARQKDREKAKDKARQTKEADDENVEVAKQRLEDAQRELKNAEREFDRAKAGQTRADMVQMSIQSVLAKRHGDRIAAEPIGLQDMSPQTHPVANGMRNVMWDVLDKVFHTDPGVAENIVEAIPADACSSLVKFAAYCLTLPESDKPGVEQEADLMHGIALLSGIFASDAYALHGILGTAFGGAVNSTVKKEGGHMYGLQVLCGISAVLEGTASVENRMNFEHADHVKSIMKFEKGLCLLAQNIWIKNVASEEEEGTSTKMPLFKPMMVSSSIEHTEDFYGKACVASHGQTFSDAISGSSPHGAYLFTKVRTKPPCCSALPYPRMTWHHLTVSVLWSANRTNPRAGSCSLASTLKTRRTRP